MSERKPLTKDEGLVMIKVLQKMVDDLNPYLRSLPTLSLVRDNLWDAQMSLRMAINSQERHCAE
jgi:hypothetical protein